MVASVLMSVWVALVLPAHAGWTKTVRLSRPGLHAQSVAMQLDRNGQEYGAHVFAVNLSESLNSSGSGDNELWYVNEGYGAPVTVLVDSSLADDELYLPSVSQPGFVGRVRVSAKGPGETGCAGPWIREYWIRKDNGNLSGTLRITDSGWCGKSKHSQIVFDAFGTTKRVHSTWATDESGGADQDAAADRRLVAIPPPTWINVPADWDQWAAGASAGTTEDHGTLTYRLSDDDLVVGLFHDEDGWGLQPEGIWVKGTDATGAWSMAEWLLDAAGNWPHVVTDPSDGVHAVWEADSGGLRFAQCAGAGTTCAMPAVGGGLWTTPAAITGTGALEKHPYAAANAAGDLFVVYEVDTDACDDFAPFDGQVEVRWRCASDGVWRGPSVVADDAAGCAALAWGNGHSWAPIVHDEANGELDVAFVWDHDDALLDPGSTPTVMAHATAPLADFPCP